MANNPNIMENISPHFFQKGKSGNPAGSSAKRRRAKQERILADQQFEALFGKGATRRTPVIDKDSDMAWMGRLYSCNASQLKEIAEWKECPAGVKNIAICILKDMMAGKTKTIDMVRERLFGKATQIVELTGKGGEALMPQRDISEEEIKHILQEMQEGR